MAIFFHDVPQDKVVGVDQVVVSIFVKGGKGIEAAYGLQMNWVEDVSRDDAGLKQKDQRCYDPSEDGGSDRVAC